LEVGAYEHRGPKEHFVGVAILGTALATGCEELRSEEIEDGHCISALSPSSIRSDDATSGCT
jgi:hypothetical protein